MPCGLDIGAGKAVPPVEKAGYGAGWMGASDGHPETVTLPDICMVLKLLTLEYQPVTCGKSVCLPRPQP
jgi:hypothetical protein